MEQSLPERLRNFGVIEEGHEWKALADWAEKCLPDDIAEMEKERRKKAYKDGGRLRADKVEYYARNKARFYERTKEWRKNNPDKYQAQKERQKVSNPDASWRSALRIKFGITYKDYEDMCCFQNNKCAICGSDVPTITGKIKRWAVDHDHKTGKVRGLLCERCNAKLGVIEDEEWMRQAGLYLARKGQP